MYEVFNYMSCETIGYVETEADAWYIIRNDSRPLDFLPWLESETPGLLFRSLDEKPEEWCPHGTDTSCSCLYGDA